MRTLQKTAAMIAIGDELLSGRTKDANIHFLAGWLNQRGVNLREVRIVQDEEEAIVAAINGLRSSHDYVFTSGGIGPTHDDITSSSLAKALGLPFGEHEQAMAVLEKWYRKRGEELTSGRKRMGMMPEGSALIDNPVSGAPGIHIQNIFVLAGVPKIFQGMLDHIDGLIEHGPTKTSWTVIAPAIESVLAAGLLEIQIAYPDVSIGSYPGKTGAGGNIAVVTSGLNDEEVKQAAEKVLALVNAKGFKGEIVQGDGSTE